MKYFYAIIFTLICTFSIGQQLEPGILLARNTNTIQENAIDFYTGIIDRNPGDVKSILLRAELYRSINNMDAANADVNLAMSINPYSFLYLSKSERKNFFQRRNYSYMKNSGMDYGVSFDKSFILNDEYNRLLSVSQLTPKAQSLLGYVLVAMKLQDYSEADMLLSALTEEDKNSALYNDIRGVILLEKGQLEESIEYFDKAIAQDEYFTVAYHNRAVANKMLGNLDESEKDFTTALKQRADLAKIQFSKAKLMEIKGDVDGARYFYESALNTQDEYAEARLNYSVLLKSSGEYTRALIEINELIKEYPEDVNNYYVRGGLHFIYGEYSNAVDDFDAYLTANPDDYDVLFYRGLCLVLDGSTERGCVDLSVSMENGYNNHDDLYLFMCE